MQSGECLDLINSLEALVPVDEWEAAGIRVWPLVRERLWWHLHDSYGGAGPGSGGSRTRGRRLRQVAPLATGWSRYLVASVSDRRHRASAREPHEVVALGDNVSRVRLNRHWYDRLCEPILEAFSELEMRSLHLEPYHIYRAPRNRPGLWVQPAIDRLWMRSRLVPASRLPPADLPGHAQMEAELSGRQLDAWFLAEATLRRQVLLVRLAADRFRALLARVGAQCGVVVDYGFVSMAFNQACRELGIPSIELQHGVQGDLHWAYARWSRLPEGGYGLLPSVYWTWSPFEAEVIGRWARPRSGHRAVVGGNLWLEQWRAGTSAVVMPYDERVRELRGGAETLVLVTLQTGLSSADQLGAVTGAMAASPPHWSWWVRLHPTMDNSERRAVVKRMREIGQTDATIDAASELPLPALLRHTDVHVTVSSSTVLEAAALGVPSVATDVQAGAMYPVQAETGWLVVASSSDEILRSVEHQMSRSPSAEPAVARLERPSRILESIMR